MLKTIAGFVNNIFVLNTFMGMGRTNNLHLLGDRRLYSAKVIEQTVSDILANRIEGPYSDSLIRAVSSPASGAKEMILASAVVGNELRINAYELLWGDEQSCDPLSALWSSPGIAMHRASVSGPRKGSFSPILLNPVGMGYDMAEPLFSWTMPLTELPEDRLHRTSYAIRKVVG